MPGFDHLSGIRGLNQNYLRVGRRYVRNQRMRRIIDTVIPVLLVRRQHPYGALSRHEGRKVGGNEMNTGRKASRAQVVIEGLGRAGFHQVAAIFSCLLF